MRYSKICATTHGTYVFYCVFQLIPQLSIQELYYRRQDRGNSDKIEKLLGRTQEHCVSVCAVRTVCRVVELSRYTTMEFTVRQQSTPTRQCRHRPKSWSSPDPLLTSRTLRSTSSLQACIDEWADIMPDLRTRRWTKLTQERRRGSCLPLGTRSDPWLFSRTRGAARLAALPAAPSIRAAAESANYS